MASPTLRPEDALLAVQWLTVVLGLHLAFVAARAFWHERRGQFAWLAAGLLLVTVGVVSEPLVFGSFAWTSAQPNLSAAAVTLAGFGLLVYSVHT